MYLRTEWALIKYEVRGKIIGYIPLRCVFLVGGRVDLFKTR